MMSMAFTCLCLLGSAQADETAPRGTLNVDRDLVLAGTRSQLDWQIQYPAPVTDVVDIINNGTVVPKKNMRMRVRTLGVAFQSGNKQLPLDAYWSLNNGSWQRFFYGISTQVKPADVLVDITVKKNDKVDFAGRGYSGSTWYPLHHTRVKDPYVIVLKNGDRAPSYAPAYDQASVDAFLKPYIDGSGRIRIGNRDLIILWEASTAAPGTTYFDMQDLVVLVTFE